MKRKILIILFTSLILILGLGITYSAFTSETNLIVNQEIASFIFEATPTDQISLKLSDLKPGDSSEYNFSVSNTKGDAISNVKINYQISIATFHFIPLDINLYKIVDGKEEHILKCDEKYSRNDNNEVVCTTDTQTMDFTQGITEDYIIKTSFDSKYNDIEYSDLVDFIDIEIKSWQKVGATHEN